VWPLNIGQVYTTLARLERDGLVAGSGGRDHERQHVYSITAAGRRALADWFAESPADGPPPRDDLIAKVLLASAGGTERALAVVTAQRTALFSALQARRKAVRAAAAADGPGDDAEALAAELVQDALVARAESELRWLDKCEARLIARRKR
jgi:DNA-binding PadR family transcriptional regulator